MAKFILPYEPDYVAHREAERAHKEAREWLQQRERQLDRSPPLAPEPTAEKEKAE